MSVTEKVTDTDTDTDTDMKYIRLIFPFLVTILLWRLSVPFWNPAGILAMIPIFYYSFIRPTPWFAPFAGIFCFLIDYRFDTLLFWTSLYCLFYAVNGLQNFVDLTRQKYDGALVFLGYFGAALLILALMGWNWTGLARAIWLFLWAGIWYMPFTSLSKRLLDD